ncbi:MAG: dihydrolipoyl dehydrogenase family protein [Leptospirales bacterium]
MGQILKPDICVIGGGAGGLVVAAGGAALGARVLLVEKERLGGDCLYHGCVPSKALLKVARTFQTLRDCETFGLPSIDSPDLHVAGLEYAQKIVRTLEPHDSPERFEKMGVRVLWGEGTFVRPDTYELGEAQIQSRKFVIATGSSPFIPEIPGLAEVSYLTNKTIFEARYPISRLLVLGAGAISSELSQAFVRLGVRVTVIFRSRRILSKEDPDLAEVVQNRLERDGVEYRPDRTVLRAERGTDGVRLLLKDSRDQQEWIEGSHLLVATGRIPNLDGLGLEEAGVKRAGGKLVLDPHLRTTNPRIFACGDASGSHYFTHMAEHQASVVLKNALFHLSSRTEEGIIPRCTFTEPELASTGLTEQEAVRQNIPHEVYRFSFEAVDRAVTDGESEGFAKAVTDRRGRLLGASIVGSHAGELIHEMQLALHQKMRLTDLAEVIHVYPTLSQIHKRLGQERLKTSLTPGRLRWIKRIFGLHGAWDGSRP